MVPDDVFLVCQDTFEQPGVPPLALKLLHQFRILRRLRGLEIIHTLDIDIGQPEYSRQIRRPSFEIQSYNFV